MKSKVFVAFIPPFTIILSNKQALIYTDGRGDRKKNDYV